MRIIIILTILLSGCRKDPAPKIDPYELNGFGMGFYCLKTDSSGKCLEYIKLLPSQMEGMVCFKPEQLKPYIEWCYNPKCSGS